MAEYRKKLIEVALPLPEINDASAYDKMPGIGPHPKGIHQWWARLPLPTARAVLFASVIDDPSSDPEKFATEDAQNAERERLFDLVRELLQKRLHKHPEVYAKARAEMLRHTAGILPPVLDPFSGGGSIPLEAARLGFEAHAADLNPVAVLLNKCNLELVPRWIDRPPVNPTSQDGMFGKDSRGGVRGLADDVRYYGNLIRARAIEEIGHLYPKVTLPAEYGEREANVIAWLWSRTVASPDPAAGGAHVPLIGNFWLSSPKKKKKPPFSWISPVVAPNKSSFKLLACAGTPANTKLTRAGTKTGDATFKCLLTGATINTEYIKKEGFEGRMGVRLTAVVADSGRSKAYLSGDLHPIPSLDVKAQWKPEGDIPIRLTGGTCYAYGLTKWADIFTPRQLTAMVTLSTLAEHVRHDIIIDAKKVGLKNADAEEYSKSVTTFLALTLNRCADLNNSLCTWNPGDQVLRNLFKRQAVPMVWDFAEANILGDVVGGWSTCTERTAKCIETMVCGGGNANQYDAASAWSDGDGLLISTDPPYYDNISYATLSDFFYVWLRRTIGDLYPELFRTILVPKVPELTAAPERFEGNKVKAKEHFELGFRKAFSALRAKMNPCFPLTVYYAFKQEDERAGIDGGKNESGADKGVDRTTGWETLLDALLGSGFQITATWPVRASQKWRMVAMGTNALASYIVLACRARPSEAPRCSRRDFLSELKKELPAALNYLRQGNIAPVDLAQSAIGPGIAIFSRYAKVMESSGQPMSVRTALGLINQTLDEVLAEQEADLEADTRWALAWFEQHGMEEGEFGDAETLSRAKNTAVNGLVEAGIVSARAGKVRLVKREELPPDWEPEKDQRLTVWEATQNLIRSLDQKGESGAAELLLKLGGLGEVARDLAYRIYSICERKGWANEALAYNSIVLAWPEISKLVAHSAPIVGQQTLFE